MITRSQNYPGYDGWYEPPRCEALVKETTAVVFGWSAAQSKHVRAYTKLYSADLGKYCFARNDRVKSIIVGYFNLNQHLARFEILVPLGYPVNWTFLSFRYWSTWLHYANGSILWL